ncbi:MAG TPA: sterol desaturase family protein [Kofleriaceae bacterium]|nr:sterol desaturase family protein [Kofleriaceae bacterium]
MKIEDLVAILVVGTWAAMLALEAVAPRRPYPRVRAWRISGAFFLLLYLAVGAAAPLLVPASLLEWRLLDLTGLGVAGGMIVGFAGLTFASYWYHRACHRVDGMWRWLHQVHHSAPRLDLGGAMVFHPLEMAAFTLIQVAVLVMVLGIDPRAAALVGYASAFYGMFQHLNVRTPRWIGFFIQRPESHGLHHEAGVHARNYSDLPLWDLLFGTFSNPARFDGEVGFGGDAHRRVGAMLFGRDVSHGTGTAAQRPRPTPTLDPA